MKSETYVIAYQYALARSRTRLARRIEEHILKRYDSYLHALISHWVKDDVERDDYLQEARLSLLRAMKKYKPEKGAPFIHYLKLWVQNGNRRYSAKNRPIPVTQYVLQRYSQQARFVRRELDEDIPDFEENETDHAESLRKLLWASSKIPSARQRMVVRSLHIADIICTPTELAVKLRCSTQNIYEMRKRAVTIMREALDEDVSDYDEYCGDLGEMDSESFG